MDKYLLVNLACLLVCALPFLAAVLWFKRRQASAYQDALRAVQGADVIVDDAHALRVTFDGSGAQKVQGTGILLLTAEELYFLPVLSRTEIRLKRERIVAVDRPEFRAGTRQSPLLLQITFTTDEGNEEKQAWLVEEHAPWISALLPLRR